MPVPKGLDDMAEPVAPPVGIPANARRRRYGTSGSAARSRATLSDLDDKSKVERAGGESNGRVSTPSELARSLL